MNEPKFCQDCGLMVELDCEEVNRCLDCLCLLPAIERASLPAWLVLLVANYERLGQDCGLVEPVPVPVLTAV